MKCQLHANFNLRTSLEITLGPSIKYAMLWGGMGGVKKCDSLWWEDRCKDRMLKFNFLL